MITQSRFLRLPLIFKVVVFVTAFAATAAFAARPIARWDVIPDQRVSGIFRAGVCAFHEDGVSVEFRVNGEIAYIAEKPTLNPRTGVWEYVFPVNTALLPDGPVTLGARAFTLAASPEEYTLPDLPLFANHGGSLTVSDTLWVDSVNGDDTAAGTESAPLLTLKAAVKRIPVGGTVYLRAGEYSAGGLGGGSNRPYWTTIAAAPGVARDDVQIAKGRPGTQRLRFKGVSLYCDADSSYTAILDGENGNHIVWLDDCKCYNKKGRWAANAVVFGNNYIGYVTGGLTTELTNGPGGTLLRDHEVRKIASDVWTGSDRLVVNCTSSDVDGGDTGAHPDFHQSYAVDPNWVHDVILYNVTGYNCKCQGLFGVRLRDSAFVNVVFERTVVSDFLTQYSDVMENVLFAHITLINQTWLWRDSYTPTDVRVYNSLMGRMSSGATVGLDGSGTNGLLVSNCFFYRANGSFGLNAISGDPHFADTNASDYALLADSPALANFRPFQCIPTDFRGVPWSDEPSGLRTLGGADSNRFAVPADRTWPASTDAPEVCLWKDDAFAAGSITIDDNCAYDHNWWLEQARENDLRLTWFVITDNVEGSNPTAGGTWPGWQRLADAGHAINSHSTNHRGEPEDAPYTEEEWLHFYGGSQAAVNDHVTNNYCSCIAYPGGSGNSVNTNYAARFYISGRGTTGTPNPPAKINYLQTCASSASDPNPYLTVLLGGTVESPAWLNSSNFHRGWFVSIVHSVQSNTNTVGALIQAYVSRRPDLWVDTYPAVAKYGQERDTATLSTYAVDGDHVVLTLSDGMDDALFDEPLTLKVRLPAAWTNLVATQAGAYIDATTVATNSATFALVNAVPDAGAITLYNLARPEGDIDDPDNPDEPEEPDDPAVPGVFYVNAGTTTPVAPYGTPATAAPDIATALALATDGNVIYVTNGLYVSSAQISVTNAVSIIGISDDPSNIVVSNKAFRTRTFFLNHPSAFLANLTVTGGQAYQTATPGGNVRVDELGGTVSNCVIRGGIADNWTGNGGNVSIVGADGLVTHCRILDATINNEGGSYKAANVFLSAGRLEHCLVAGGTSTAKGASQTVVPGVCATGGSVRHCTIAGNSGPAIAGIVAKNCTVAQCVIAGNFTTNAALESAWSGTASCFSNCITDNASPINDTCAVATAAALFADSAHGDYTLAAASPAIDAATTSAGLPRTDLAGAIRHQGAAPDLGCFESASAFIPLSVSFSLSDGIAEAGSNLTFTATAEYAPDAVSYAWDFGDGATATTAAPSVTHAYAAAGSYTVSLTATSGSQTATFTTTITVAAGTTPDPPTPPDPIVPVTTNVWIGANTTTGSAAQTDFDDPANWSLARVPGVDNDDIALFPLHRSHADLALAASQAFAPAALLIDSDSASCSRPFLIDKSLVLSKLLFKPYGATTGGGGAFWTGRVRIGTNSTELVTLTLTGNGDALDLTGANAQWSCLQFGTEGTALIDFTGTDISFSANKGTRAFDSSIQGGTTAENADGNRNGTLRFSTPGAHVHLAAQGPRGSAIGLGTANLAVRSDQTWTADPTAYIRSTARIGPSGVAAPPLVASVDGGRLDNLGALNFVVTRTSNSSPSATTCQRILGGTYGSLRCAGGNTSRRDSYYALGGDVVLAGHCVLPLNANPRTAEEAPLVSATSARTTPHGLQMLTGPSQISNWFLDLAGHTLVVSNGVQLADAENATTSSSASSNPDIRIHALDAHLTVLGDLDIHADNKAATNTVHGNYATRYLGIRGNAGTVLDLGGSFRSNCRSLYLATSSANNNLNQNFSTATVNLIGGADVERTFEVADASTLDAPARNTFSIGTLHVGTDSATANIRLVNEYLNDNPTNGWTEAMDPNDLRAGERLVAGTLSIGPGSRLAVNGQQVRIAGAFTMAPTATLDLCTDAAPAIGTEIANFRATGDQTAAWSAFASRVKDSTAPAAHFAPAYDAATDTTFWVSAPPPQRTLFKVR